MKIIIGLGNPGILYANTRHNIGFSVVKSLARSFKIPLKRDRYAAALSGKGIIRAEKVIVALPLTFMNLSGNAVKVLLDEHELSLRDLLVVCDDLDLEFGRIKIRPEGSAGGHHGLESIIEAAGSKEFARLRVGIGKPHAAKASRDYVLSSFKRREKASLKEIVERSVECCQSWVTEGMTYSMNIFNIRSKTDE